MRAPKASAGGRFPGARRRAHQRAAMTNYSIIRPSPPQAGTAGAKREGPSEKKDPLIAAAGAWRGPLPLWRLLLGDRDGPDLASRDAGLAADALVAVDGHGHVVLDLVNVGRTGVLAVAVAGALAGVNLDNPAHF